MGMFFIPELRMKDFWRVHRRLQDLCQPQKRGKHSLLATALQSIPLRGRHWSRASSEARPGLRGLTQEPKSLQQTIPPLPQMTFASGGLGVGNNGSIEEDTSFAFAFQSDEPFIRNFCSPESQGGGDQVNTKSHLKIER
ncbi:hypothetical protein KIL84_015446 [Mauremys mutica]|uniref:Uncharacterized protein n=1 Tax=Mauremys mutica TaxID=74926 RepID=A0A9D4APY1_9SAUR|nr:hypothetical protein KIL84_015446 [Mauremys mutica]